MIRRLLAAAGLLAALAGPAAAAINAPVTLPQLPFVPLAKSGDTMGPGALLNITLNGAPSFASLQTILADIGTFYAYGGKADGAAHPLSGTASFNGLNTSGYTLAQWQALFAGLKDSAGNNPVTALSNEADEVAVQAMVNKNGSGAQTESITLPAGYLRFTHNISSGCSPISIKGSGRNATTLAVFTPGADLWHHGTADTACPQQYGAHFEAKDFIVRAANFGNRAFDIAQSLNSEVIVDRVEILGGGYTSGNASTKGSGGFFVNGIRCQSCSNVIFNDTYLVGPYGNAGAIAGNGLELTGGATGSMLWRGGFIGGYHTCMLSYSGAAPRPLPTAVNGDNEGPVFDGMQSTGCDDVYTVIYNGNPPVSVPEYKILHGQYGTTARHFINFNGPSDVTIDDDLVYSNNPFGIFGATYTAGSTTVSIQSFATAPQVGQVITASYSGLPAGTTVVSVSPNATNPTSMVLSAAPTNTTAANDPSSAQPTQAFTATATSGNNTLTGVSAFNNDANGYMIVQKDGCVYGVPGVSGCDAITAVDGYNMTVTVATAPNASGSVSGTFRYPEVAPYLYQVNNGTNLKLWNQDLQLPPGNRFGAAMAVANAYGVSIKGWLINDLGNVMTAGFYDQGGNKNIDESGTVFGPGWGASGASVYVATPNASNSQTVQWGSYNGTIASFYDNKTSPYGMLLSGTYSTFPLGITPSIASSSAGAINKANLYGGTYGLGVSSGELDLVAAGSTALWNGTSRTALFDGAGVHHFPGTAAGTAGTINKLDLYNGTYGLGVSGGELDLVTASGSTVSLFAGSTRLGNFTPTSLALPQTTTSTSPTTGALTVAGGVGIAGALNLGGPASVLQPQTGTFLSLMRSDAPAENLQIAGSAASGGTAFSFLTQGYNGSAYVAYAALKLLPKGGVSGIKNTLDDGNGGFVTTGPATIGATTASTSATTGSLTTAGGLGVAGDEFLAGGLNLTGTSFLHFPNNAAGTAGTINKVDLYGGIFGIGVSGGELDLVSQNGGTVSLFSGTTKIANFTSTGLALTGTFAAPGLATAVTGGSSVKGTLCVDATGSVYVKTTTGACL